MRGPDQRRRRPRPSPVRDGWRPSYAQPKCINYARWLIKCLEHGNCVTCGKARGANGTRLYCRGCADKNAARERARRAAARQA